MIVTLQDLKFVNPNQVDTIVLFPGEALPFPARVRGLDWVYFFQLFYGIYPLDNSPEAQYLIQVRKTQELKVPYPVYIDGSPLPLGFTLQEFLNYIPNIPWNVTFDQHRIEFWN